MDNAAVWITKDAFPAQNCATTSTISRGNELQLGLEARMNSGSTSRIVRRSSSTFANAYSTDIRRLLPNEPKSLRLLALPRGGNVRFKKTLKNNNKSASLLRHCYHLELPPARGELF